MSQFSLSNLLKNPEKLEQMFKSAHDEFAKITVDAQAGAGMVTARLNAQHRVLALDLSDEFMANLRDEFKANNNLTETKKVLTELIMAAINQANDQVDEITKKKLSSVGNIADILQGGGNSD